MADPAVSEGLKRIQSILMTIEQKNLDVAKSKSNLMQLQIGLERAELALKNARVQLLKELEKFDPEIASAFTKEELEAANA